MGQHNFSPASSAVLWHFCTEPWHGEPSFPFKRRPKCSGCWSRRWLWIPWNQSKVDVGFKWQSYRFSMVCWFIAKWRGNQCSRIISIAKLSKKVSGWARGCSFVQAWLGGDDDGWEGFHWKKWENGQVTSRKWMKMITCLSLVLMTVAMNHTLGVLTRWCVHLGDFENLTGQDRCSIKRLLGSSLTGKLRRSKNRVAFWSNKKWSHRSRGFLETSPISVCLANYIFEKHRIDNLALEQSSYRHPIYDVNRKKEGLGTNDVEICGKT